MIKLKPSFLFTILSLFTFATVILIFSAGLKLTNLALLQIIHLFNNSIAFCQGQISVISTKFRQYPFYLGFTSLMFVAFWIYIRTSIDKTIILLENIHVLKTTLPSFAKAILRELGIGSSQVVLYKSRQPSVFCAGFCKPKIYISANLLRQLDTRELTAVLAHETQHLRNYDPLRTFILSVFERLFSFLPLVKQLSKTIRFAQERIADDFAVGFVGRKAYLQTIVKIDKINFTQPMPETTGFDGLLNKRVNHLLGRSTKINKKKIVFDIITTQAVLLGLIFLSSMPIIPPSKTLNHSHTNIMCKTSFFYDCCVA